MKPLAPLVSLVALSLTLLHCSGENTGQTSAPVGAGGPGGGGGQAGATPSAPSTPDTPAEWNRPTTALPAAEAEQQRAACAFEAGALPAETLGDQVPPGPSMPIEHFVLVMMENRSFDHYFQGLKAAGVADVDVAPETFSNRSSLGKEETIRPMDHYCIPDVNHEWSGVHQQVSEGMSGFVTSNEKGGHDGARALGYLTESMAPVGYFLAKNFAISDRHFCSLLGPTWPNRMFFYGASSFGLVENTIATEDQNNIFEQLDKRGVDWRIYKEDTPGAAMFVSTILGNSKRVKKISQFYEDARNGALPPVSYVDPQLISAQPRQSSQHPPANHQYGEQFFHDVVKAVTESPQWAKTALILTYDEHGGFYDHVEPPRACPPDDLPPSKHPELGGFDRLGIRVPLIVVSPFAKKNYVSHVVTDHSSVLRLIEHKFQLPAMTRRDANAASLVDLFDFKAPPGPPPALPPRPELDAAQEDHCTSNFSASK